MPDSILREGTSATRTRKQIDESSTYQELREEAVPVLIQLVADMGGGEQS
jgi:hypothetical protein